jgi:hypothetical protein
MNMTYKIKKNLPIILSFLFGVFLVAFLTFFMWIKNADASSFNPGNLISDGAFINTNSMSENDIQNFLEQKGSLLKDFSENGRRASKIIYDAAHGHGDASGEYAGINITETVSPEVILATIQKEEGLIEGYYSNPAHYNQTRLNWAMGYAVCDSCSLDDPQVVKYKGFTKQIENAVWTMRYNYEKLARGNYIHVGNARNHNRACPDDSDDRTCVWQGDYITMRSHSDQDDYQDFTIDSKASAVLYRYTPYVYYGNYNFWSYFNNWFVNPAYDAEFISQSKYLSIGEGETQTLTISYRNTGSEIWRKGVVNLGTVDANYNWKFDDYAMNNNWLSGNRPARLDQDTVVPGEIGTFTFTIKNNGLPEGNYRLDVGLVADGVTWFSKNTHAFWNVVVPQRFSAQWVSQSDYMTIYQNEVRLVRISYLNTGSGIWHKRVVNLGLVDKNYNWITTKHPLYYASWLSYDRPATLTQDSVLPGQVGTFEFYVTNPGLNPDNYRLDIGLVADGITWFPRNTQAYWDLNTL